MRLKPRTKPRTCCLLTSLIIIYLFLLSPEGTPPHVAISEVGNRC